MIDKVLNVALHNGPAMFAFGISFGIVLGKLLHKLDILQYGPPRDPVRRRTDEGQAATSSRVGGCASKPHPPIERQAAECETGSGSDDDA